MSEKETQELADRAKFNADRNEAISKILEKVRSYPAGADIELGMEERVILDSLFASRFGDVGYYWGHRITFRGSC